MVVDAKQTVIESPMMGAAKREPISSIICAFEAPWHDVSRLDFEWPCQAYQALFAYSTPALVQL